MPGLNKSQPWLTWGCSAIHSFVRPCLALLTRTALGPSNVCRPEGRIALRLSIKRYPLLETSNDNGQGASK